MTIFNDTNRNRVIKIQEILSLIEKSAISNKASAHELWQLLTPAIDDISTLVNAETMEPEQAEPAQVPDADAAPIQHTPKSQKNTDWYQMHIWAYEMPLVELNRLVAIYVNRIADELDSKTT